MDATRKTRKSSRQYVQPHKPAGFLPLQHPKLVGSPPSGAAWLHEIKFDGYRMQAHSDGHGRAVIYSRNGNDWTSRLPELAAEVARLPECILDGELCALGADGQPNFSKLRASLTPGKTVALVYFAFDCLWRPGEDLRPYALTSRRHVLGELLDELGSPRLRLSQSFEADGETVFRSAVRMGLEGIVSKRADSTYSSGRGETWLKIKQRPSQEVVIGGWKQEPGRAFKGLLVGTYDKGRLRYAGSLKTGFSRDAGLLKRLREREQIASPFEAGDPPRKTSEVHWVRPELVAAAEIAEWTASGKLRQASFKGLREDKDPLEVVREG